ncbi:MAG: sodium:solute symporter family transporter [Chitinophagaceae bacterium]
MHILDWIVLIATLTFIIGYGLYKSSASKNLEGYFLSNRSMPWYLVLLSIMGTQASAITFLSAPGQAFTDGMRFVQYYFGLPLAMIVLCITFVPLFSKLKVFTAYEFLEQRFDIKVRSFTALLFLISRGLSTGISIYAPSIILSSLLGWDIFYTNIFMGGLLIIYTVSGGAKAVAYTQTFQLIIIFIGMFLSGYYMIKLLPNNFSFSDAIAIGNVNEKMNVITTGFTEKGFDWQDKYNIFSGIIGGFFLALSYFGTDQSQVGRYLTAKNDKESKQGLLMNGLVKIPMQFFILLIGVLMFTFYQFNKSPIYFDKSVENKVLESPFKKEYTQVQQKYDSIKILKNKLGEEFLKNAQSKSVSEEISKKIITLKTQEESLRKEAKQIIKTSNAAASPNDTNYIFLRFVIDYLPAGLVGLLIAIIFLSAWGSIAAALNSLASCTMIDFHNRFIKQPKTEAQEFKLSKMYTFLWGVFCIVVAQFASGMGSLIEAVNVLGSLFYGVILGIFLVAFYCKSVQSKSVLIAAIVGEIIVVTLFVLDKNKIIGLGFLWLNVVGALAVVILGLMFQTIEKQLNKV